MHLKEHRLDCDVRAGDVVFYFTTCGWMMWNWLVSALASEATIVLFDGNPFHPGPWALFDLVDRHDVTLLGVSAKFIDACARPACGPATRTGWPGCARCAPPARRCPPRASRGCTTP